jgi:aminoglycoside phosphotransferase (APT) family kinase protein
VNLQPLFSDTIQHVHHFGDLHPGQASDVWLVTTPTERAIVRTTRMTSEPTEDFWFGCRHLFGINPTDVFAMELVNRTLRPHSLIPVPHVLRSATVADSQFLVVEVLDGLPIRSFRDLPEETSYQLGQGIASIHQLERPTCGNFRGTKTYPASDFHQHAALAMSQLVRRFHANNEEINAALPMFLTACEQTEASSYGVPVLLDMDATQFLSQGTRITGLIDTEAYAFAPPHLDLIALEYLLDKPRARAFQSGYQQLRDFPDLRLVRPLYRYLNLLLSVQGKVPFKEWMNHPAYFD